MKRVVVISHSSIIEGPIEYYIKYLKKNNYHISTIDHPLNDYQDRFTIFDNQKKLIMTKRSNRLGTLNLLVDFFLSIKYVLNNRFDIFIGANNFDTFIGIFLKKIFLKKIAKIIYFASDYSEDRFKNILLNKIYYFVESICCKYSDLVISNTKRAEKKRIVFGLKKEKSLIVPNGVLLNKNKFDKKVINKANFIYVGSITNEHGLFNLIKNIYPLINKLVLIGYGDEWEAVVNICKNKHIKSELYYKKSHEFCINYLQNFNGFGLAPYNLNSKWTYYCSPLKVAEYISCGIPVIMSSVPEIAGYVKKSGFGIIFSKLNFDKISSDLKFFDTSNFNIKAKKFYNYYNQNYLYSKIKL